MEIGGQLYRSLSTLCVLTLLHLHEVLTETVYMDKYGDCFHEGPIEVDDEVYTIQSQGGAAYDTLICEMTFKSTKNDRLCLSFKKFQIDTCFIELYAYSDEKSQNNILGTYTCHTDDSPETVCSEGKYLTVLMKKQELSHDGYDFTLDIRQYSQSDALIQGKGPFNVKILVIVGIIVGVLVIVLLTTIIIISYRKYGLSPTHKSSTSSRTTEYTNVQPVEPSAPPLEEPPAYSEHPPPYCTIENTTTIPLNTDISHITG